MTLLTAFDADVLIYAAAVGHPLGVPVASLFAVEGEGPVGIGSVLLLPEVLTKPLREDPDSAEVKALAGLLGRLELRPVDEATARLAVALAVTYRLRAADAVHLATAVASGADRFLTNNRRDFATTIDEIDVVYPEDLANAQT